MGLYYVYRMLNPRAEDVEGNWPKLEALCKEFPKLVRGADFVDFGGHWWGCSVLYEIYADVRNSDDSK